MPDGDGLRVTTASGRALCASTVVVAAGGWLPGLAARLPGVAAALPPLTVTPQQAFHFPFADGTRDDWPVLLHKDGLDVKALPGGRDAGGTGFEVAEHDRRLPVDAAGRDGVIDAGSGSRAVGRVRRHVPGVEPRPYAETSCLCTTAPPEDFVVDRVGLIVVAPPCSGHGAKSAPLTGALVADAATGGPLLPRLGLRAGAMAA